MIALLLLDELARIMIMLAAISIIKRRNIIARRMAR